MSKRRLTPDIVKLYYNAERRRQTLKLPANHPRVRAQRAHNLVKRLQGTTRSKRRSRNQSLSSLNPNSGSVESLMRRLQIEYSSH